MGTSYNLFNVQHYDSHEAHGIMTSRKPPAESLTGLKVQRKYQLKDIQGKESAIGLHKMFQRLNRIEQKIKAKEIEKNGTSKV